MRVRTLNRGDKVASIINGLFAARAGIASHGTAIGVVGDNISNSNTIGFKGSRADFSDLVSGGQPSGRVVGIGSQIANIVASQQQGTLEFTGRNLDLAVDGRGHFVVADGPQRFFSRAGNFKLDDSGFIVTNENMAVLGFPEGGTGALEPINVNSLQQQTNIETRNINLSGNINSNSTPVTLPATPSTAGVVPAVENVTFAQLAQQASFSTVVQTFDTLGSAHNVSLYFYKNAAPGSWTVWAVTNSSDVDPTGTRQGYPRLLGTQTVTFGTNGQKTSPAAGTPDITFTSPWNNNSNPAIPVTLSFNPFTQYAASSNILMINQDGLGIGSVSGINIEKDGRVFALLSNGQTTILGTLALAKFSNDEGLVRLGGNLLQQTLQSGEPVIGRPQAGDLGGIEAGSLELSTVDVASEFVRLISLQRGFQANSRIISTVNQLLGEIVQVV